MRIDISTIKLMTILRSKTLSKILAKILEAYEYYSDFETLDKDVFSFSMEDLRKSLRYKNKSTVSRGLKALADYGLFTISTNNQGTVINFKPEKIKRV